MNILKSLLNPISQLSFDIRGSDKFKIYNAEQVLNKLTHLTIDWKSLPHSQFLNVVANLLGYYTANGETSWSIYIQRINEARNRINQAYQILTPSSFDWLEHEDGASARCDVVK